MIATRKALAAAGLAALGALIQAGPAAAQTNSYSFLEAERSAVRMSVAPAAPMTPCSRLSALSSAGASILSAELVPAKDGMPEQCVVQGVIAPEIRFLVNLPSAWNRRLYMHGNSGYAGESPDGPYGREVRDRAVKLGFVTAMSNGGHDAQAEPWTSWANNNLQKEIDFGYRALHLTSGLAKRLARAYYDRPVAYSYLDGCSTGGGQGLKAAQRFPGDFDGIVAGAPIFDFVGVQLYGWVNQMAVEKTPLSAEKVALLGRAVMQRCDAADGAADGVVDDPRKCDFDPGRDLKQCPAGGDAADCHTAAEIDAFKAIYGGVRGDGRQLYPGAPLGAENAGQRFGGDGAPQPPASGWATRMFSLQGPGGFRVQKMNVETWLKFMAFEKDDANFDWTKLDIAKDLPRMAFMSRIMDGTNADLGEFRRRGGKLLMYHGWADTGANPLMTAQYYDRVLAAMGPTTPSFFRTFMVPGMFHCNGGFNVDRFDAMTPLINWVENGVPPDSILATRVEGGQVARSRPLCPYPQVARYSGSGSVDAAENFRCVSP